MQLPRWRNVLFVILTTALMSVTIRFEPGQSAVPKAVLDGQVVVVTQASASDANEYLRSVALVDSVDISASDLDHVLELREAYGLSVEPRFVQSLYSDPINSHALHSDIGLLGGIRYSSTESPPAFRRAAAEWVGYKIDIAASERLAGYAGTIIEPDGSITLLCAHCLASDAAEETVAQLKVVEPFRLVVKEVVFSHEDLLEMAEAFSRRLAEANVPHGGYIDTARNQVVILVEDASMNIPFEVPDYIELRPGFKEVTPDVDKDDAIAYGLVEGGQLITPDSSNQSALTSGFPVHGNLSLDYMITAGHYDLPQDCGGVGNTYSQGGSTLGIITSSCQYGGDVDAMLILTTGVRVNWGRVHYTSADWAHQVTFGVVSQNLINATVCQTGVATTGMNGNSNTSSRCGLVSSVSSKSPCSGASPEWHFALGAASYLRNHGDSGAAVVWPTVYGFGAAGTHSCVGFGGTGAIFSRWSRMASRWGLTLSPFNL